MKRLKKAIISLSVAILLTCGMFSASQNVYGKSETRHLIGTVISVDLNKRTMEVVDRESKKTYTVKFPKNKQIKLSVNSPTFHTQSYIALERVVRGLIVDVQIAD